MTYLRGFNRKIVNWDLVSTLETFQERYGSESGWQVRAHVMTMERFVVLGSFETEREARKALTAILNDALMRGGGRARRAEPAYTVVEPESQLNGTH